MATWVRPARHERHDYARHNRRSPPRRWVPLRPRAFQRGRRPEMSRRHESPNRSSREHMPHRGKKQRNYRDPDRERGRAKSMSHDSILSYDDEGCLKKKGDAGQKANGKGARAKYPTNQDMSLDERGTGGYGSFKRPVVDPKSSDNRKDLFEEKMLARSSSISRSSTVTSSKSGPYPAESRAATHPLFVPEDCTHAIYQSSARMRAMVRSNKFQAQKKSPIEAVRMVWYRNFDLNHSFDPGSLQNIFNIAMLRAQKRAQLGPTALHVSYNNAINEAFSNSTDFMYRDYYILMWMAVDADFYILENKREKREWAERVSAVRGLKDKIPNRELPMLYRVDTSTVKEIGELPPVAPEAGQCSEWFSQAMETIVDGDIAY